MPGKRVQQSQKAGLVRCGEKPHETFRFIVEAGDTIGGRVRHCHKRREGNQLLRCDRFRVRFGNVAARAFVSGVCVLRDILRESLIQPTRNAVRVKAVQDEVNNLVTEKIVAEFVGRIALDEETSGRMNSTAPRLQFSEHLKLLPFFRALKNIDVRFRVCRRLVALQFFCDDAVMEFRFY